MYRNIDVKTEMRKLSSSKPVHAVTGAGMLASQALRNLPGLLARWGTENPVASLPSRAAGYAQTAQARATGYVHTAQTRTNGYVHTAQARAGEYVRSARAKAAGGYDTLAARGQKALSDRPHTPQARNSQSTSTPANSATAKGTQSGSTGAQGKAVSNGKGKGKPTSRATTSN